jgi:membrane-associated phospholipid phosphatase
LSRTPSRDPAVEVSAWRRAAWAWTLALLSIAVLLGGAVDLGLLARDDQVLLSLAQTIGNPALDWSMFALSLLGSIEVSTIVMLAVTWQARRQPLFWVPLAVFAAATLAELAGKAMLHQPPPSILLHRGPTLGLSFATAGSFPSGHMTRATLLAGILGLRRWVRDRRTVWLWATIAFVWMMGFGRVYLGEHWPVDVAGGILLGGAGLALCLAVAPGAVLARDP